MNRPQIKSACDQGRYSVTTAATRKLLARARGRTAAADSDSEDNDGRRAPPPLTSAVWRKKCRRDKLTIRTSSFEVRRSNFALSSRFPAQGFEAVRGDLLHRPIRERNDIGPRAWREQFAAASLIPAASRLEEHDRVGRNLLDTFAGNF